MKKRDVKKLRVIANGNRADEREYRRAFNRLPWDWRYAARRKMDRVIAAMRQGKVSVEA